MRGTSIKERSGTKYSMGITITFTPDQFRKIRNTSNALERNLTEIGRELILDWSSKHKKEREAYLKSMLDEGRPTEEEKE